MKQIEMDSLMIGILISALVQALYDVLKNDYAHYYPSMGDWGISLSALIAVMVIVLLWKIPVAIRMTRQGRSIFAGQWKAVGTVLGLFLAAIVLGQFESYSPWITLLVVVLCVIALPLLISIGVGIGRDNTKAHQNEDEKKIKEILDRLESLKKQVTATTTEIDSKLSEIRRLLDTIPKH